MEPTSKKILIIEDEKQLARVLEIKLSREGFEITNVTSGEAALPLIETGQFSLIICDLMMPKVDGFQVLEFIKSKNIIVPVIVLTNLSQPEDEKRARELGALDFLIKSDTPLSKIIEIIKEKLSH
ncbi:MAG: response regulator [Minisyncoccia bacterium]